MRSRFVQGMVLLRVVGQQPDQEFRLVFDLGKFDEESMTDWRAVQIGAARISPAADSSSSGRARHKVVEQERGRGDGEPAV